MRTETRLVRLWQTRATDAAIQFITMPPGDKKAQIVWIPRSLIEHVSRDPKLPSGYQPCNVTLAAWKAEELGL